MGSDNHFDITAMTKAAESPDYDCKLIGAAFEHLPEKSLDQQYKILKEIADQNARSLKPGEDGVRLFAHKIKDDDDNSTLLTLIRSEPQGITELPVFNGAFVGKKLVGYRICGQPQNLLQVDKRIVSDDPHHQDKR